MNLRSLGYNDTLAQSRKNKGLEGFDIGRVSSEHKERYSVITDHKEYQAEITGNLRYSARDLSDFPAVGDWVALIAYDDDKALIHEVLPRKTMLARKVVAREGEKQVIATNIDFALIVQAIDRDFSINRLERYLTICHESNVAPMVVLSKTDLIEPGNLNSLIAAIENRMPDIPVFNVSNVTGQGIQTLNDHMQSQKTYCLLGSSGVGKSTLLNALAGRNIMDTGDISSHSNRGKHITSHRELFILDNGAILIDNPGMRELGISDAGEGLEITFDTIVDLARQCKFKDCSHTSETGCAVIEALDNGSLDEQAYHNYLKLEKEKAHFEQNALDRKKKEKGFGKMVKNMKKFRKDKDF